MLSCYILDDEQHAVDALTAMLRKKFVNMVEITGSSIHTETALKDIETREPDILFLDVEMPEMTGLEFLRNFPSRLFDVIFTTAHEKYALPAIKAAAADYLVKPLSPQDVHDALVRCKERRQKRMEDRQRKWLTLNTQQDTLVVNPADIIRVEAASNYSIFYFTNRHKLVVSRTLREFDKMLSSAGFFRVHQSHLINLHHLVSVNSQDGDSVVLTGGQRIEISRRKKLEFMHHLQQFKL